MLTLNTIQKAVPSQEETALESKYKELNRSCISVKHRRCNLRRTYWNLFFVFTQEY